MDKLVDFLIQNLQPAIDAVKQAAPDVIAREAQWIVWVNQLMLGIGISLAAVAAILIITAILSAKVWDGDEWPVAGGVLGTVCMIIGIILIIVASIELRHMQINPAYMLLKHFMPGD